MAGLRNRVAATASVLAFSVMLGGCQMLGIGGHRSASSDAAIERAEPGDLGAAQLAEGRRLLKEGRTVDAIESFMLAKAFPQHAPAAFNGLAVAYSRLGRTDLTERFFLTAVALAPEDDRYRSNLAVFYAQNPAQRGLDARLQVAALQQAALELAPVAPVQQALADVPAPVAEPRVMRGGVVSVASSSTLRRVSSREVSVGGAAAPARVASVGGPLPVVTYRQPRKAVIEVGGKAPAEEAAKVALADKAKSAAPTYPVRIELEAD